MKNQLIYILALLMIASVFTGCGSKSADTAKETHENHAEGEGGQDRKSVV